MATLTGENLLNSVIESSGVELNTLIHRTLSANLQQMIDNDTFSNLGASIAMSGFSTAIHGAVDIHDLIDVVETNSGLIAAAEEGDVGQIEFPPVENGGDNPSDVTPVDIDTGTLQIPADFDAGDGAYNFMDDAAVAGNVVINNFSSDDCISFSNADPDDYSFANDGSDVMIINNYNDQGIVNAIKLTGVVSSDALVFDQASFTAAIGFDAFAG